MRDEVKKYLESRMLGNLHVRFGVGVRARFPGLHHADITSTNQATAGDSVNENITALDAAIGNDVAGTEARTVGAISVQDVNANIESLDDAIGADVTSTKIVSTANSVNSNISALDVVLGVCLMYHV
jgi:hypothetical protein